MHGRDKKCIKSSVGKHERRRSLRKLKRKSEDNIKMDFREQDGKL